MNDNQRIPSTGFVDVINNIHLALKHIINILTRPLWINPTTGSIRLVDTVTTVTTVTAASDITRLNNWGASSATAQPTLYLTAYTIERANWANSVRANIA